MCFLICLKVSTVVCQRICLRNIEVCHQRIHGVRSLYSLLCLNFLGFFLDHLCLGSVKACPFGINLAEPGQHFCALIGLPELEVSGSLKELTYTLGLLDTRQLDEDTSGLVQLLDVGLNDTEAVDTRAEHVERVVDSSVHFLAQHFFNLCIGGVEGHFVFELKRREHRRELRIGVLLFVRLDEKCDEVDLAVFLLLFSSSHGLCEVLAGVVARKCIQDVGNTHFHRYVHTALQVKAEVDFLFTALFEGVAKPHFLACNGVQIDVLLGFLSVSVLLRLFVVVARYETEGEIEGAYQSEAHGQDSNNSFVLHFICYLHLYFVVLLRHKHPKKPAKLLLFFDISKYFVIFSLFWVHFL